MSAGTQQRTVFELLRERIPEDLIKHRQAKSRGGQTTDIRYIDWPTATELLDQRAPGWTCEIKEVGHVGDKVFIRVALTIQGVTRENIGYEDDDLEGYGDPFSNSYAMAVKRAAALFGLGRHLYDKQDRNRRPDPPRQEQPRAQSAPAATSKPMPQSLDRGELINGGQMTAIRNHCAKQGIDVDEFIATQAPGRQLDQLSFQEGVQLISAWSKSN